MAGQADLAVIGAGVAGTFIADAVKVARPGWSIVLVERSSRVGGRLRSMQLPGIADRIELGGMRFPTSHRRANALLEAFGLEVHPFDRAHGARSFLRGRAGGGPDDPHAGEGYDLSPAERGRSATSLAQAAFERILPGAATMDAATFRERRRTATYLGRKVTDWSMADALATVLSAEGHRFVADAFGYDSGIRAFNAADGIEFLLGGGDPTAVAVTPDDGMDSMPKALAARFVANGGELQLDRELVSIEPDGTTQRLQMADGESIDALRTVLTMPIPALRALAAQSPALQGPTFTSIFDSAEGFPAMKLYLWYDRPWWRPAIAGLRTTTDLATRKTFYVDAAPDGPSALLAMYTDGRHVEPWVELAAGASNGQPAPAAMLSEVQRILRTIHPEIESIPEPAGSALMHWGSDPLEIGWTFWRPGAISDEIIALAPQPDPALRIHIAGEAFSHYQSWTEGPLESAELVIERILA